jgi:hypothetical protein
MWSRVERNHRFGEGTRQPVGAGRPGVLIEVGSLLRADCGPVFEHPRLPSTLSIPTGRASA